MNTPRLHPNLARAAASYDDVIVKLQYNQIDPATARAEIESLVARDDDGVFWRINPDSGQWERQTAAKVWVKGTPPAYGLATPTAHDFSAASTGFNPDTQVTFQRIDPAQTDGASLVGATRKKALGSGSKSASESFVTKIVRYRKAILAAALFILAVAAVYVASSVWTSTSTTPTTTPPSTPATITTVHSP